MEILASGDGLKASYIAKKLGVDIGVGPYRHIETENVCLNRACMAIIRVQMTIFNSYYNDDYFG